MDRIDEILCQLDKCNAKNTFPMLDNGYVYPAGTRLSAYSDENRWAIIIEAIGFNYRGMGHNGILNSLHIFGNCLEYPPGIINENFLRITDDSSTCTTFDDEENFYLNPNCESFCLRDYILPIIHEREKYESCGIQLEDEARVNAFEFLRLLDSLYHDKLVATEIEIRTRIPKDIPEIIRIEEWFHPDVVNGDLPSNNETFQQIAKVIETGNIDFYKPTQCPNTHWRNWPDGGML